MTAIDHFQGHGEAAVKLHRDWMSDPQYIKTHALVVLLQKGLQYYEIEQSINQVCRTLATNDVGIMVSDGVEWYTIVSIIIDVVFWTFIRTSDFFAERRS